MYNPSTPGFGRRSIVQIILAQLLMRPEIHNQMLRKDLVGSLAVARFAANSRGFGAAFN